MPDTCIRRRPMCSTECLRDTFLERSDTTVLNCRGGNAPLGDIFHLLVQGCVARPIQTFNVSDEFDARQAGVPDLQGRIALGTGEPVAGGAAVRPRERPVEIGLDGHWGRRRITLLP